MACVTSWFTGLSSTSRTRRRRGRAGANAGAISGERRASVAQRSGRRQRKVPRDAPAMKASAPEIASVSWLHSCLAARWRCRRPRPAPGRVEFRYPRAPRPVAADRACRECDRPSCRKASACSAIDASTPGSSTSSRRRRPRKGTARKLPLVWFMRQRIAERQLDDEGAADPRPALCEYGPSHQLRESAHDGKSEAGAAKASGSAHIRLGERFEDPFEPIGSNADAGVLHFDAQSQ